MFIEFYWNAPFVLDSVPIESTVPSIDEGFIRPNLKLRGKACGNGFNGRILSDEVALFKAYFYRCWFPKSCSFETRLNFCNWI